MAKIGPGRQAVVSVDHPFVQVPSAARDIFLPSSLFVDAMEDDLLVVKNKVHEIHKPPVHKILLFPVKC